MIIDINKYVWYAKLGNSKWAISTVEVNYFVKKKKKKNGWGKLCSITHKYYFNSLANY